MPDDFEIQTVSEFCRETKSGSTPSRTNNEYWENGTISWVKSGEVHNNITLQTEEYITCAVQDWGCLNMADSAEWYRGNYRGMQDCRGAIRYMISNKDQFNIDPNNVFLIGESAGGFITMASAYLDDESIFRCQRQHIWHWRYEFAFQF